MQKNYRLSKKQEGKVLITVGVPSPPPPPNFPQVTSTLRLDGYG